MNLKNLIPFLGLLFIIKINSSQAQINSSPKTFCNPLNLSYRFMADAIDAREAADPVIVLYKNDYYLFASRSGGYWTSPDLRNWSFIIPDGLDIESYAPALVVMRDTLFYLPGGVGQIYKSADPKSGIWTKGPTLKSYGDPCLFSDDDSKLYVSYGVSNVNPISIIQLDPVSFKEIGSKIDVVYPLANIHGWERRGDDNLLDESPWIEGSWLIKNNGKYYLHYAGPGTEFKTYSDGICTADSPMGPYTYAPYSPIDFKPSGFINGAGHGCTFKDKSGNWWHIGTMTISVKHMFERRLDLYPVSFDSDGNIHCNTYLGDYPMYLPGEKSDPVSESFAGMMLLSNKKYVAASSSLADHPVSLASDEDARTYWAAQTGGPDEWLMMDLGGICSVEAIQVNFAEHNTNPDLVRGRVNAVYEQYILQTSTDGMNWTVLADKSNNMTDVPHDYLELTSPVNTRYLKLINVHTPGNGNFAVRDLRVFGNMAQSVFTTVSDFTVTRATDDRNAVVRWTPVANADGYVVSFGVAADKLYNSYVVYDTDSLAMQCLNHGVEYFFGVQAFDNGTEIYKPVGELRSFQSGDWSDLNTWAESDGTDWIHPASSLPSGSIRPVTIREMDSVRVSGSETANQLTVAAGGILIVEQGATLTVKNGIETDLLVEGTIENYGTIVTEDGASLNFEGNGFYVHHMDGGTIPPASWRPNSSVWLHDIKNTVPNGINQNFYNFTWGCSAQATNLNLNWTGITIGGDFSLVSTGSSLLSLCDPEENSESVVNIKGKIIQYDGRLSSNNSSTAGTVTLNCFGNIEVTGGNFSVCRGNQGGTGTTRWNLYGNVSLSNASTQNSNPEGASFVFAKEGGSQSLTIADDVSYGSGGFPVEVADGASLDMGTGTLGGDGSFRLNAGATLITGLSSGIEGAIANTGTTVFSKKANFGFNGLTAQSTGSLLPDTVAGIRIYNAAGVKLSGSVVVNGSLELASGTVTLNGKKLVYGSSASLVYNGTVAQTSSDSELPATGGPSKIIVSNPKGLTLHASREVEDLELGYKLITGANTLTVETISSIGQGIYVNTSGGGSLAFKSVGSETVYFPIGTTNLSPVWISNAGTQDRVGAGVVIDNNPSPFGAKVKLKWTLDEDTPGGGNYTLKFGWLPTSEEAGFKKDRPGNSKIFKLSDSTETGTGDYSYQFVNSPLTVSRGGIDELGTFGVGIFGWPTGIKNSKGGANNGFGLSQNFPNPVNTSTTISFQVPYRSFVSLKIYNMLGEEMAELAGSEYLPGTHSVLADLSGLPHGMYYYTLRANDQADTRKMILIK
jgi:xylan 1,4-beta-xylosidase